jgi:hypothetical protein
MVGRTRRQTGLTVTFTRDGEPPQALHARDPEHAWAHGIALISQHETLLAGDKLTVVTAE